MHVGQGSRYFKVR